MLFRSATLGQFHGLQTDSWYEREAVSPNVSLAPGSLGRSWREDPGDGVEELVAVEDWRATEHALSI